jgi:hypothetical protein
MALYAQIARRAVPAAYFTLVFSLSYSSTLEIEDVFLVNAG